MFSFNQLISDKLTRYSSYLLLIWWIMSFIATHMPLSEDTDGVPYVDKIVHIIIYMILSFLLSLWLKKYFSITINQILVTFIILLIYAFADEALQSLVARTPDIMDIVADAFGVFLGVTLFSQWEKISKPKDYKN